ncbi:hypothetical protein LGK95_03015 [Clostridium algoriphilum]|uniref:hypothetical protein n=1 Tax=Clostridium algoriphilum TaxID=198347 RepID=UPI001CF22426|nr:hypothetical protein [Clostridium algoriphilum]MCB2292510.1 hypothetical protein [Clostridium algoriphilum]
MKLDDRDIEDIDMQEDYELVPLEPTMCGYGQMNMMPNMGMQKGYMQDVNPNMRMNLLMGINQDAEMNPWMGMNQFNEGMFMNGFNPMGGMYSDISARDYEDESFKQEDKYQEKDPLIDQYRPAPPISQSNDVERIVRRIERYNPAIFRRMTRCGIPYLEARELVRRIVRVTLMYRDE